jgi:adenylate cyclase
MGINALGWVPGAFVFPFAVCALAGEHNAEPIWRHFAVSFTVSALLTTVQTFFLCEAHLIAVLYPEFFKDARPAQVHGAWRIPFSARLTIMWMAVGLMPLIALLVVAQNIGTRDQDVLLRLAAEVTVVGVVSGGLISYLVGRQLHRWIKAQSAATEQIALGHFDVRVPEKRPDEWGRLTDDFNDMAAALGRAQVMRETFGQIVGPRVRDSILERYQGVSGEVCDITVLFADIRGFTQRSAGESPDRVFELLNRVLTLAVAAVEKGDRGLVNKFLGDGFMALFGADRDRADHADLAVAVAVEFITRLEALNRELEGQGEPPLRMGVGIHSGPALVGCIGASLGYVGGREQLRREFTAIGETVNLAQRVEQLTKTCGGAILLSEETRSRLKRPVPVVDLGPQPVPGLKGELRVYRVLTEEAARGEKAPA